jgi:dTDP-4-amino-4,6-dideoxygalactose transaminase
MNRNVQMLDLKAEMGLYGEAVRRAALATLDSGQFIGGPAVGELETALAARLGTRHALAISNGTDALVVALMGLDIRHGDEVIVPAFTFMATAGAVARVGAKPVFCDIDAKTFNINPAEVERRMTPRTRAILVVHLYGQCAAMDEILAIAGRHGVPVIEDAAQAVDARYGDRPACSLGAMACLSFYPTKNLGGIGEGGMVLTSDDALATRLRQIRNHGETQRYHHDFLGGNFRLDTMKCAMLLAKLPHLTAFTERRRRSAAMYDRMLAGSAARPPHVAAGMHHVYHQYTVVCDRRDELKDFLAARGVGSTVYYPIPLHLQRCFAELGGRMGDHPVSEAAAQRVLSLPCHPMMSDDDVRYVAEQVHAFGGTSMPAAEARLATAAAQ